ncbi:MAG TPA: xanthine dehydrogenase family protein molybdopterin-binding subunit [Thermoanaerobaculia bacterium]|nr:xanthine dehydrogenase family protein molybdopterin-binding subunit [Thermoanaerobaculia bacterium]
MIRKVSRREFVKVTSAASAGLILSVAIEAKEKPKSMPKAAAAAHDIGAFVQVDDAGVVTIWVPKSEMGQGVRTALPMIVAEELDADWKKVQIRQAYLDKKFGRMGTGGSSSVRTTWKPLREAGAAARAMLVSAAAAKLAVPADSLSVSDGVITHAASGRKVAFGEVAADAAMIEVPKEVKLKEPAAFKVIGRKADRLDNPDIVTGKATYGIDVRVPGMLYAVVKRSPAFGGTVASFDDTKAKAVPGVRQVVKIDAIGTDLPWNGVAVIADSTWAAMKGREALDVKWNPGAAATESTESIAKQMQKAVSTVSKRVLDVGNVDTATVSASKKIDATYELPFLAHATMEPMNATASVTADGAELWLPTQFPDWAAGTVAKAVGVKPEQVKVNVTLLGGGFGRKANPDFATEAALLSKAAGKPVHVHWTREDDMQHDYYRPASVHRVIGALDPDGRLIAWDHHFAAPAIETFLNPKTDKPQDSEIGGLDDLPYSVPNYRIEFTPIASVVPRGWWRSVEYSINGFVINSFLDEVAHATGKDPIELQLSLLTPGKRIEGEGAAKAYPFEVDRLRRVIEVVRDRSGWGKRLAEGRGRGFAAQRSFLSYVAQVADVSITKDGLKVDRIVCAIDCGTAVNPDGIAAQVEGAIAYGLTAALHGEITTAGGAVQQSNFHDYPLLRIGEMPVVEVHIVPSTAAPTGTGEPGLPPAAPAIANAIFAATGKRLRKLPFKLT